MFGGWETAFGFGALALLITLAYGVYHTRRGGRTLDRLGEAGARRIYDDPQESDAPARGGVRHRVPPLIWVMAGLLAAWLVAIATLQTTGALHPELQGAGANSHER